MMYLNFLDKLLSDTVDFPITIIGLLFFPDRIIGSDADLALSSPGVTFTLGFVIWLYVNRVWHKYPDSNTKKLKIIDKNSIIFAALLAMIIIMLQWLSISMLYHLETGKTLAETIGILSYTISATFCVSGLVKLFFIIFPISGTICGRTIDELWDRAIKEVRDENPSWEWNLPQKNAKGVAGAATIITYIIVSVNIIRTVFYASKITMDVAKVSATFVIMFGIVYILLAWLISRFDKNLREFKTLQGKEKQIPK